VKHTPFIFFSILILALSSFAQIPNGSIAPDFTVADIDGNTHNLYTYLDQGKTCIINFSATWAGPCWNYHASGALQDVYDALGPEGTDEVVVLFIESDSLTTVQDLSGITVSNPGGDYTANTTYPIIDVHTIKDLFEVTAYPTILTVCPNRRVEETGQLSASEYLSHILFTTYCGIIIEQGPYGIAQGGNNVNIVEFNIKDDICGIHELEIIMRNQGTDTLISADFAIAINGLALDTFSYSGNLTTFQSDTISIQTNYPIVDTTVLEINAYNANGSIDADTTNNWASQTFNLKEFINVSELNLKINTDQYAYETYWVVLNNVDTVIAEGGNSLAYLNDAQQNNGYASNSSYNETIDLTLLPEGCYKLIIIDSWGDGVCCGYGNGSIEVVDDLGHVYATLTDFGARYELAFDSNVFVNIQENSANNYLDVYPNPSQGIVYLNTDFTYEKIEVLNVQGRILKTFEGRQNQIDLGDLNKGMYLIKLITGKHFTSKKVMLTK